jgi:hypothetical protein
MVTQKKLAQMAAYLAHKVGDERINYMRLMKLMYLADRESLEHFGEPISQDEMYSLDLGLILSDTYDTVKSKTAINNDSAWSEYFSPRRGEWDYFLGVKKPSIDDDELDCLSRADIEMLNNAFAKFGHLKEYELSDYMHEHCDEWEDPNGSRIPVDRESLLRILGLPPEEAAERAADISTESRRKYLLRR